MNKLLRLLPLILLCGCPGPSGTDGGTGGGIGTGGGSGGGGGGTAGPVTFAEYCTTSQASLCDYGLRCGIFDSRAGCEEVTQRPGSSLCEYVSPSVKDGRQSFNGTLAAQCFQDVMTGCQTPASCVDFFTGQVAVGQSCFVSDDCVTGTWCDFGQQTCPGSCQPRHGAGTQVATPEACLEDLGSTFGILDGGSFGYVCQTRGALSRPCTGYGTCVAGLVCNEGSGVCETPRGPNVVCSLPDGGVNMNGGSICADGLFCQPVGSEWRCGAPASMGQPCGQCRFDLRCAEQDGGRVCSPRGTVDQSCEGSSDCVNGLFCKPINGPFGPGTCRTPGAIGDSCTGSSDSCRTGLNCESRLPSDGGFFPEYHCAASDGGTPDFMGCVDPTP